MKARRVRISLEAETDAPLNVLNKAGNYRISVWHEGHQYVVTVHQALADAQQEKKDTKIRRR